MPRGIFLNGITNIVRGCTAGKQIMISDIKFIYPANTTIKYVNVSSCENQHRQGFRRLS